jgi:hypothetical protein
MIERLEIYGRGRWEDILTVCLPNGAVLAAVTIVDVNHLVVLLSGLVTMGYAFWRWRRDSYVVCGACREGRIPAICPLPAGKRPIWCPRNS